MTKFANTKERIEKTRMRDAQLRVYPYAWACHNRHPQDTVRAMLARYLRDENVEVLRADSNAVRLSPNTTRVCGHYELGGAQRNLMLRFFLSNENSIFDEDFWDYGSSHNLDIESQQLHSCVSAYRLAPKKFSQASWAGDSTAKKTKFCAFLHSHMRAPTRNAFYQILSRYRRIDALGRFYRNSHSTQIDATRWQENAQFYAPYKFVMSFENSCRPHYITEKLLLPMFAGSVPIYWGGQYVNKYYNPARFINAYDFDSLEALAKYVLRVDADDKLYNAYLAQPIYTPAQLAHEKQYQKKERAVVQGFLRQATQQVMLPKAQANLVGRELLSRSAGIALNQDILREQRFASVFKICQPVRGAWPFVGRGKKQ